MGKFPTIKTCEEALAFIVTNPKTIVLYCKLRRRNVAPKLPENYSIEIPVPQNTPQLAQNMDTTLDPDPILKGTVTTWLWGRCYGFVSRAWGRTKKDILSWRHEFISASL